jgi:hypothetical protein
VKATCEWLLVSSDSLHQTILKLIPHFQSAQFPAAKTPHKNKALRKIHVTQDGLLAVTHPQLMDQLFIPFGDHTSDAPWPWRNGSG